MITSTFSCLNTNDMPWQADPDIPGFKVRLLRVDDTTRAVVKMWYLPPRWESGMFILPHRHYHKTVTERAYHLFGDFPHWEFSRPGDHDGELIVFHRHLFMDRPPMSIHGGFEEPKSETGSLILYWNTGPGTGIAEPEAPQETIPLPFDDDADSHGTDFTEARLFDTRKLAWQTHPTLDGCKIKPLAEATQGSGAVAMVNIPPDWTAPDATQPIRGGDQPCWSFVISGDVKLRMAENGASHQLTIAEDGYLEWGTGATLSFTDGATSEGGCAVLCIGHDLSKATA